LRRLRDRGEKNLKASIGTPKLKKKLVKPRGRWRDDNIEWLLACEIDWYIFSTGSGKKKLYPRIL